MTRRTALTPELIDWAADALVKGYHQTQVYQALGISETAWHTWVRKGRELLDAGLDSFDESLSDNERLYMRFAAAVETSRAIGVARLVDIIAEAAHKQWQAAAWLLERGYPHQYSKRERGHTEAPVDPVHIYVPDNGKVEG